MLRIQKALELLWETDLNITEIAFSCGFSDANHSCRLFKKSQNTIRNQRGELKTMAKEKMPVTPAIRVLREQGVMFTPRLYKYEERGGTAVSARELGVDEHLTIKTLIMEDEHHNPLIILMHGDREVSTRELARFLGVKSITPCRPEIANKHSGYLVGGTSPFGTHRQMPVYMEETIAGLPKVYINAGKRGFLVEMQPEDLIRVLQPVLVRVGISE